MKKSRRICFFLAIVLLLACLPLQTAAAPEPTYDLPDSVQLHAPCALVASLSDRQEHDLLLGGKDIHAPRSPAALVRLMAGAYAATLIEQKKLDIDKVTGTFTYDCFNLISGTGIGTAQMNIGEVWTLRDLLTMSMMQTAGDAIVTLAVALAGDHASFVAGMNGLATKLGCENTHFVNVTGLDAPGQVTTAYDLYLIMRYAMTFPELRTMMGTAEYTVQPVSGGKKAVWVTGNSLLRTASTAYYAPVEFGRTGYTDQAGRCVVAVASSGGYECLTVVLGCPETDENGNGNVSFTDTRSLMRWSFGNFSYKVVLAKGEILDKLPVTDSFDGDTVSLISAHDVSLVVPADLDANTVKREITYICGKDGKPITQVTAPVKKGDVLGRVKLYINMKTCIGEVQLVAGESLSRNGFLTVWNALVAAVTSPWLYVGLGALAVCIGIYVWALVARNRSRRKKSGRHLTVSKSSRFLK